MSFSLSSIDHIGNKAALFLSIGVLITAFSCVNDARADDSLISPGAVSQGIFCANTNDGHSVSTEMEISGTPTTGVDVTNTLQTLWDESINRSSIKDVNDLFNPDPSVETKEVDVHKGLVVDMIRAGIKANNILGLTTVEGVYLVGDPTINDEPCP